MGEFRKKKIQLFFIYLFLSAGLILNLAPLAWMLSTSFKPGSEVFRFPPKWIPDSLELVNYKKVFSMIPFERYYLNSILSALLITFITVLLCMMAGYAFAKMKFPGRNILFMFFLITLMIPFQATMIPLFRMVSSFGWIDTFQGLIIPQISTAFGIFLVRQFMLSMPDAILEAAQIDGCSEMRKFWHIVVPMNGSVMATLAIFTFNTAWNNLLWPLLVTNSEKMRTLPVGMALFKSSRDIDWTAIMAGSVMSLIPMIILFLLMQKQFIRGITAGAVKE
ncbi:carbohydrate ABC transporter membrane protein 2, CUT1 family [Fontibacillus panacisegetis]|uniref:Carbohydrate ABC transporter membrane protein 2, CUT1 family n=1 Tax=Fontibacillus panacisegetis TaxID=670482 RepID=A0A1G7JRB3_9BACL|nr:carbohydrate ABC transporter permease [Fontibacillus panacisegetis]SDF27425.1 carbohydrate ABC transporter membrane protein 2, CUT1 family [Fontibacillus panacisegetis]